MEFGRYKIITELGNGGMAKVYLGEDPTLNRLVAVKVIHPHLTSHRAMLERFAVEARIAASLKSPHIVDIYDYGIEGGSQYFIMEYIEGHTLDLILENYKKASLSLPQKFCASVICQAAEGLAAAEKHKIVHRDIKPANLMFTKDGTLKISDFGIAKIGGAHQATMTGTVVGTPLYISPEQYRDASPTIKSDIWALGVTFYQCLTGKLPFSGESIPQIINNVCNREHESVLDCAPHVNPELAGIVDIMLRKEPDRRCESSAWLVKRLRQYLGRGGIFSPEDGTRALIQSLEPSPHQYKISEIGTFSSLTVPNVADGNRKRLVRSFSPISEFIRRNPLVKKIFIGGIFGILITIALLMFSWKTAEKSPEINIKLFPDTLILYQGEQSRLRYKAEPPILAGDLEWETDHPGVVSVVAGIVSGKRQGVAKVSAILKSDPAVAGTCMIKVISPDIEKLKLPESAVSLKVGDSLLLKPEIFPEGAEGDIIWTIEPQHVAVISEGLIIALEPGNAVVTVRTAVDPSKKATSVVIVEKRMEQKKESAGLLKITSAPPFAIIKVNGVEWGKTPMRSFSRLPVGRVNIEIFHRSYMPRDTVITINNGDKKRVHFTLDQ